MVGYYFINKKEGFDMHKVFLILVMVFGVSAYGANINYGKCEQRLDKVNIVTKNISNRETIEINKETYNEFLELRDDLRYLVHNCKPEKYKGQGILESLEDVNEIIGLYRAKIN
jgi:hypothetical protein